MPPYLVRLLRAALAHALFGVSMGLLILLPVYLRDLGASHAYAGFVTGVSFGVGLCVRPPTGWALDRLGRRPVLLAGAVLTVAGAAVYLAADAIGPLMYLARVFTGAAEGMLFTAFFTYAADIVPADRRAQGLALFGISGLLPMAVAPALGELVIAAGGFAWLFRLSLVASALALCVCFTLPETLQSRHPPEPMVRATPEQAARRDASAQRERAKPAFRERALAAVRPLATVMSPMVRVVASRSLLGVWILMAAFGVGLAAAQVFVAPTTLERTRGPAGTFFLAYGFSAILVRVFAGGLPDRLGHARVAGPALVVYSAGLAVLALSASKVALVLSGAAGGVGHGILFPAASAMAVERAPAQQRGAALAATTGVLDLCYLSAPPLLGWVGDRQGATALFASAAVAVLGGLWAWRWAEKGCRTGHRGGA